MIYQDLIEKIEKKGYKVILKENSTSIVEPLVSTVTGITHDSEISYSTVHNEIGRRDYLQVMIERLKIE